MPTELRQIVFTKDEFVQATLAYNRVLSQRMIMGKVTGCELEENAPVTIIGLVKSESGATETKVVLETAFIREALIRFCLENNIVIPRSGEKSVSVRRGHVALIIRVEGLTGG